MENHFTGLKKTEPRSSLIETCSTFAVINMQSAAVLKYTDSHTCISTFFAVVVNHLLKTYTTVYVVGIAEKEVQIF